MARLPLTVALLVAALFAACGVADPAAPAPAAPQSLRVLTYNIHHGEGTDARFDLPRLAKIITDAKPDVVAVQEVDVKTQRSAGVDQAAELARLTGMHVAFGKAIDYQGGQYGQALLSRTPLSDVQTHRLPGKPESEQRIAVSATIRPWGDQGPLVLFVGTHLDHVRDDSDRRRQADEINRLFVRDDGRPVVLAGDLNSVPDSEVMKRFTMHWKDAPAAASQPGNTVPAGKPRNRIDYVLLRPPGAWRVVETTVLDEPVASDHRPVLAVLQWRVGAK